jgi:hypothetical protein
VDIAARSFLKVGYNKPEHPGRLQHLESIAESFLEVL